MSKFNKLLTIIRKSKEILDILDEADLSIDHLEDEAKVPVLKRPVVKSIKRDIVSMLDDKPKSNPRVKRMSNRRNSL